MFSELSLITTETGLGFDAERAALYGELRGFGATLTDTGDTYELKVFCLRPFERSSEVTALINALNEGLPKNSLLSQSCEVGYVLVTFDKYSLLQENVIFLTEFLDKLTVGLEALGLPGSPYSFPRVKEERPESLPKDAVKVKLGFDARSAAGFFGALAGAAAMIVIAILTVDAKFEINTFELRFEVSTYIVSAVSAAVIFADYRFISRKLDACGIITCPLLAVLSVILSGLGAGAKACAGFAGVSFLTALKGLPDYLEEYEKVGSFIFGYISRGLIVSVLASVLICVIYFERHPDETVKSEKTVSKTGDAGTSKKR